MEASTDKVLESVISDLLEVRSKLSVLFNKVSLLNDTKLRESLGLAESSLLTCISISKARQKLREESRSMVNLQIPNKVFKLNSSGVVRKIFVVPAGRRGTPPVKTVEGSSRDGAGRQLGGDLETAAVKRIQKGGMRVDNSAGDHMFTKHQHTDHTSSTEAHSQTKGFLHESVEVESTGEDNKFCVLQPIGQYIPGCKQEMNHSHHLGPLHIDKDRVAMEVKKVDGKIEVVDNEKVRCKICRAGFPGEKQLVEHRKNCVWSCDVCGEKPFLKKADLTKHKMMHNPHICTECGAKFNRKFSLKRHVTEVHGEFERESVTCHICGKMIRKATFTLHLMSHTDLKPFECDRCNLKFRKKGSLKKHKLRVHDNVYGYSCDECGKQFKHRESLKPHVQAFHSKGVASECDLCSRRFSYISSFLRHLKEVHKLSKEEILEKKRSVDINS